MPVQFKKVTANILEKLKSNDAADASSAAIPKSRTKLKHQPTIADLLVKEAQRTITKLKRPKPGAAYDVYENIVSEYQRGKKLYEDLEFPATMDSVYPDDDDADPITWKRPKEICSDPKLFDEDGASRFDVRQGDLGDCWVLAAVASLTNYDSVFELVVPRDQNFQERYCGAFHFRFWRFGFWIDIIVDDRLPVVGNNLMFMASDNKNEFWSALLEKAYAKLNGSYGALNGGNQAEAMEDFTGGLCEVVTVTNDKNASGPLYQSLMHNIKHSSLMGCSIDVDDNGEPEEELANGLLMGHAYSITDVREIPYKGVNVKLIRVRNPWGDSHEWRGAWSDDSEEWKSFSEEEKQKQNVVFSNDGEFWMPFDDFVDNFTKTEICHLGPESLNSHQDNKIAGLSKRRWEMKVWHGKWEVNVSAGGCRNFLKSFVNNPQYVIDVVDPDEDDNEDVGTLILGLMQKDMRKRGLDFWTIGVVMYKVPDNHTGLLTSNFFTANAIKGRTEYINQREVVARIKLSPGRYVLIPTTFEPNEEAEFILRVFSEHKNPGTELDNTNELSEDALKAIAPPTIAEDTKGTAVKDQQMLAVNKAFDAVADHNSAINAFELKDILNAAMKNVKHFQGFNAESCRSMVALMDKSNSGLMEFVEFSELWSQLRIWTDLFGSHDADNSGNFDAHELREALNDIGFRLSNKIFSAVSKRYADPNRGVVSFEDFILLIIRLKNAFESFRKNRNPQNKCEMTEEEVLMSKVYI